jgi:fibronectin type 3 domain-containing protein
MTNRTLSKLPQASNSIRSVRPAAKVQTVTSLSRLSSIVEPLESRTMMSAVHLPVHTPVRTPVHVVAKAPAKTKTAALVVPSAVTATASSPNSVKVAWTEGTSTATGFKLLRSAGGNPFAPLTTITNAATLSYTDNAVVGNITYVYEVEAYNSSATSAASSTATVKTPLITPAGLTAAAQSGTSIALTWTNIDGGTTGYEIYRSTDASHYSPYATINGVGTAHFTDSNVTSGKAYEYEIQATNSTNSSAVSTPVKAVTPLAAPSGLAASAQSSTQINLSWTDKDPAATAYTILRSTNGTSFSTLTTLNNASATTYTDNSAAALTHYYYQVQAINAVATSAASASASVTTPLSVPGAVTAAAISPTSIRLTWTDTDAAATGYVILKATSGGSFSQAGVITSGKTTSWSDNSVSMDTTYSYEVVATSGSIQSATSTAASATTTMAAPTGLTATANSSTSVTLTWTDVDPTATSYVIKRAVNGAAFQTLTTLQSATATSYTDTGAQSGHSYSYTVTAVGSGNRTSIASTPATTVTPLVKPTALVATSTAGTAVVLTWTNNDTSATGYSILRSTNGGQTYSLCKTVSGGITTTFTDSTVTSATTYYYEIQATNTYGSSPASDSAYATTPLLAPASLTATVVGSNINLSWTDKDPAATGYTVLRSTDGINFTTLATLTSATANGYQDTGVTLGQKYYYQVQATSSSLTSVASNTVNVTVAAPATNGVTIATRNSNELVITATGKSDTVSVTQSGSTLTIVADGQSTTQPAPSAGLFIYTRGGADSVNVDQSVTVRTTVETIDAAVDDITTEGTNVSVWDDSTDIYTGDGTVHSVATFAGNVAKTTGASLPDPKDAGTTMKVTGSLWGTGPVATDINQGAAGDCYFLSSLAAFAGEQPALLQESTVDMGDGTYTVQFISNGSPKFIRVSNDISTYGGGNYKFARPGSDGDLWAPIIEKAFAYFRTGANTYSSINGGWMGEAYADLGVNSTYFMMSNTNATTFFNTVSTALNANKEVTLGTPDSPPNLVGDHAYTLISATMINGVASYVVRNPWGVQGDAIENSGGYATLTFAQMQSNFVDCCIAV